MGTKRDGNVKMKMNNTDGNVNMKMGTKTDGNLNSEKINYEI